MRAWRVRGKERCMLTAAGCCGICAVCILAGSVCGKAALQMVEPELLAQITVGETARGVKLLQRLWPQIAAALLGFSGAGIYLTPLFAVGNGFLLTYRLGAESAAGGKIAAIAAAETSGLTFFFCLAAATGIRLSALFRRDGGRFWRRETLLPYGLWQGILILAGAAVCLLTGFPV